ncbi:hypothetical protein C8J57DRAFT_722130 [Mycena rebaudengoi]|nr:hypothetical protein C8J57DRAFT_722130 [Mycena rebaudengoi]
MDIKLWSRPNSSLQSIYLGLLLVNHIAMDSQVAFVTNTPPTALVFGANSMLSSTLFANSSPVYALSTDARGSTTTLKTTGTAALVARIARKNLFSDTVTFPSLNNGKAIKMKKWLKEVQLPDGFTASLFETPTRKYILRRHSEYRLALFHEDLQTIAANWQPTTDASSPMTLVLAPGTEKCHPQIITAFLLFEQKLRMQETSKVAYAATSNIKATQAMITVMIQ